MPRHIASIYLIVVFLISTVSLISLESFFVFLVIIIPFFTEIISKVLFIKPKTLLIKKVSDFFLFRKTALLILFLTLLLSNIILYVNSGVTHILDVAAHYSYLRYVEEIGMPIPVRILNVFNYSFLFLVLLIYFDGGYRKRFYKSIFIMCIFLFFMSSFLLGTKSIIVAMLFTALIARNIILKTKNESFKLKHFSKYFMFFSFVVFLVVLVQLVRSKGGMDVYFILEKILTSYFLMPGLAMYNNLTDMKLFDFGLYSVSGISSYFDSSIVKRAPHVTLEVFGSEYETNVYGGIYYLVKDFGFLGFVFLYYFFYFTNWYAEVKVVKGGYSVVTFYFLTSMCFLWLFADPYFKELTNILTVVTIFFLFFLNNFMRRFYGCRNSCY